VCDVPSFENAEKILADLVSSPARPAAVDFVAGRHYENDLILGPVLEGHVGRLYVGLEGPAPDVDWMVEQLRSRWMAIGATEPMLIPTSRAESLWRWLTEFTPDVQINVLPSTAVETIVQALAIDPDCTVRAHAGDGILRIKLAERKDDAAQAAVVEQLSKLANTFGGKITSQYPTAVETAKRSNPELRILQAIKERFDPQNILNPGRYLFD
jgi:FAD/FMN-containing dehydrogenase